MAVTSMRMRGWPTLLATVVGLALALTGCARSKPTTAPVPVALNVPPPPPRVISTPPEPVAPTEATTTPRTAPTSRPVRAQRAPAARPETRAPEPARTDAAAEPAPTVAAPAEPAAASGPLLRTPQTADETVTARRTRDVLFRADELLKKVALPSLTAAARQQYDTARRFIEQAEQAIVSRNYVLATYLAEKAETLAKGLSR